MELLGRYSNHDTIRKELQHLLEAKPYRSLNQPNRRRRQRQTRLTIDQVHKLIDRYRAGSTLDELATEFEVHRRTVAAHLERHGIAQRARGMTQEEVGEAIRLYSKGWSLARIGGHLGVYPQSIRYRLQRAGVRFRDSQGRER